MFKPAAETLPVVRFSALAGIGVIHGFIQKVPGIDVDADRTEALARLDVCHREVRRALGLEHFTFVTAEQVHGSHLTVLLNDRVLPSLPCVGSDGFADQPR